MIHPLFVGHFDVGVRSNSPAVIKSIDLLAVSEILGRHCDSKPDGSLMIVNRAELSTEADSTWLGKIGQEDVRFEAGYLVCPWLYGGMNRASARFINELYYSLGVQIYEPSDGAFLTPELLANAERNYDEWIAAHSAQAQRD